MGAYEWGMLGGMFAIVIVLFVSVFATEARKTKKLREKNTQEIFRVKMYNWVKILFSVVGVIVLLGATAITIYCSLKVEMPPKGIYAVLMFMIAFVTLLCFALVLSARYNFVAATEEGVWVYRILLKPKFHYYEEISYIRDTTGFGWAGGYTVYKECNGKSTKAFSMSVLKDKGIDDMVALMRKYSPRLAKADELFKY